jgi:hypothetical protein
MAFESPVAKGLGALAALTGMAWVVWTVFAGSREIERASQLAHEATSVRITVDAPGRPRHILDIECPDRIRIETGVGEARRQVVTVGQRTRTRLGEGPWTEVPASALSATVPMCDGAPWNAGRPTLAAMLHDLTGRGQRVSDANLETKLPSGETCRFWRVHGRWDIGLDTTDQPRLCVSPFDQHLLLIVASDGRSWKFSDWNKPLEVWLPPDES